MNDDITNPHPHAPMVEKAVLSVLMNQAEKFDDIGDLTGASFYLPAHKALFRHLMADPGIDLVTLVQRLHDSGELETIGGPGAITEIYTYAPGASYFPQHLAILREKLIRRMARELGCKLEALALEAESVEEIIEATSRPVTEIHDMAAGSKPSRDTKAVVRECLQQFEDICAGKVSPMGIQTSLPEFNAKFKGLHPGRNIVISGYPGGGKSTLAGQFAIDAASEGHNALICSLEMSQADFMRRMIAYVSRMRGDVMTDPLTHAFEVWDGARKPTDGMIQGVSSAVRKICSYPFAVEDVAGASVHQISAAIRRAHRKSPLKVVVVDFVQRIRSAPEMRKESREQQLSHASNTLADMARELGFCLLLPSQLNKDGAAKHAEAINEDADLHLQIVQDRQTLEHKFIGIPKDRHYGHSGGEIQAILDAPMLRFIPKPF